MIFRSIPGLRSSGLKAFGWIACGWAIVAMLPAAFSAETSLCLMAVSDSITEGGETFVSYRPLLEAKLAAGGYHVTFVGSRMSGSPLGPLRHEGYGGKNVEFLAEVDNRVRGKSLRPRCLGRFAEENKKHHHDADRREGRA